MNIYTFNFKVYFFRGLDPLVFCTICGVASSAVGYMIGCTLYGVVWQWMNKDLAQKLLEVMIVVVII